MNSGEQRRLLVKEFLAELNAIDREIARLTTKKSAIMKVARKAGVPRKELRQLRAAQRKRKLEVRYGPKNPPPEDFV